jgi:ABC-type glycerol-3-phosphate transport system substrate-binding protein
MENRKNVAVEHGEMSAQRLSRRSFMQMAGTVAGVLALGACAPAAAPAPGAAETGSEGAASQAAATVAYWFLGGARWEDFYTQKIFPIFNERHPEIQLETTVIASWTDLYNKLVTSAAGGAPPELARQKDFFSPDFAVRGILQTLDDYIVTADHITQEAFIPQAWTNTFWDGKQIAMPLHIFIHYLHMNATLFEEAGLTNADGSLQAPDDWDAYREAAKAISKPDANVWGTQLRDYGGQEDTVNFFHVWLTMAGGSLIDENYEKFLFNSPEGIEALTFQVEMMKEGSMMPPGVTGEAMIENNQIGMWFHAANYWPAYLENNPDLQWCTAVNPVRVNRGAVVRGNHLAMFAQSRNKDAAWEFMSFHMEPDSDYLYAQNANYVTARQDNHSREMYDGNYEGRECVLWQTEFDQLAVPENQPQPIFPGYQESSFKIGAQLMEAYLMQKTPEEALAQAEAEATEVLESIREQFGA